MRRGGWDGGLRDRGGGGGGAGPALRRREAEAGSGPGGRRDPDFRVGGMDAGGARAETTGRAPRRGAPAGLRRPYLAARHGLGRAGAGRRAGPSLLPQQLPRSARPPAAGGSVCVRPSGARAAGGVGAGRRPAGSAVTAGGCQLAGGGRRGLRAGDAQPSGSRQEAAGPAAGKLPAARGWGSRGLGWGPAPGRGRRPRCRLRGARTSGDPRSPHLAPPVQRPAAPTGLGSDGPRQLRGQGRPLAGVGPRGRSWPTGWWRCWIP